MIDGCYGMEIMNVLGEIGMRWSIDGIVRILSSEQSESMAVGYTSTLRFHAVLSHIQEIICLFLFHSFPC